MKTPLLFTREFDRMCELSPDMLELLYKCLPFIEDAADDPCYKKGVVLSLEREIKALLNKIAEVAP
jgi:hypothetical protein